MEGGMTFNITALHITALSMTTVSIIALGTEFCYAKYWLSFMLIVIYANCHKQAYYAEYHYAECRFAEFVIVSGVK
jgi:hypothetical protein